MWCCANRPNTWMHPTEVINAEKLLRRGGRPHMDSIPLTGAIAPYAVRQIGQVAG